ncbi:MAG: fasciclin domain-containing protein [Cyanobacteria bacterium J06554_3]
MVIRFSPSDFSFRDAAKFFAVVGVSSVGIAMQSVAEASVLVQPAILRPQEEPAAPVRRLPPTTQNIVDVASDTIDFSTLTTAMNAANVSSVLVGDGPFTVFAPTDAAFAALPPDTLAALLLPENRDLLVKLLYNHVSYGEITSDQLAVGPLDTFDGDVAVDITPNGVTVDGGAVVQADVPASNGVIHAVDTVLLPSGFSEQLQARINEGANDSTAIAPPAESTEITSTTTLQETAIDRSAAPTSATSEPTPLEPAATSEDRPVRGLW